MALMSVYHGPTPPPTMFVQVMLGAEVASRVLEAVLIHVRDHHGSG
jgi:hypothetical protein